MKDELSRAVDELLADKLSPGRYEKLVLPGDLYSVPVSSAP